jgi:hypothetical protein
MAHCLLLSSQKAVVLYQLIVFIMPTIDFSSCVQISNKLWLYLFLCRDGMQDVVMNNEVGDESVLDEGNISAD